MGKVKTGALAWLVLAAASTALSVRAQDEEYKVTKQPAWSEDGDSFGWECDPDVGPAQECAFVESASPGTAPAGA